MGNRDNRSPPKIGLRIVSFAMNPVLVRFVSADVLGVVNLR